MLLTYDLRLLSNKNDLFLQGFSKGKSKGKKGLSKEVLIN
jgi:hypothetical protein